SISHKGARGRCVSCFTLRRADAFYCGDVTERSVMAVGFLPPPLLGVSSLDLAPLAFSQRGLFPCARGSNRAADLCQKKRAGRSRRATWQMVNPRLSREDWGRRAPFSNGSGFPR